MIRLLTGCEPEKLSETKLVIMPGEIWSADGTKQHKMLQRRTLDLSTVGPWGHDTGRLGGDICLYLIGNGNETALIASNSPFFGKVTYPDGWSFLRKLPWGIVYNHVWGGIPDFHLSHWPLPTIRFTGAESCDPWCALSKGQAAEWAEVDLSKWLPDNARMAILQIETTTGRSSGSASLRSLGGQETGLRVGTQVIEIRTTSTRKIQYKVTRSMKLSIYVLGYQMTEKA